VNDNDIAVKAEGLSKVYRLGRKERARENLAGIVLEFLRSPIQNFRKYRSLYRFDDVLDGNGVIPDDIIWALRDVSFEIRQGEVVGFIGRNGAGKSTLLKILTRITPPARGRAEIRGRVSSLLEVGTGFHQELTGRENIFLNGTILGMTKNEVERKFDEIVDFSGVERFLDTPVKRYSSGMAVRLAFAVAAHLEPEILIVDEVLAVGDAAFQKKCIAKMQDVRKAGRTVLFVSHNMPAVHMLCTRAIHLDDGRIVNDGPTHDVVGAYLSVGRGVPAAREWPEASAPKGEVARLCAVRVVARGGQMVEAVDVRQEVGLQVEYQVMKPGSQLMTDFILYNDEGVAIFEALEQDPVWYQKPRPAGRYTSTAWIPGNFLNDGMYFVSCAVVTRGPRNVPQFFEQQVIAFNVADNMGTGTARGDYSGDLAGVTRPLLKWETRRARDVAEAVSR
jgi:homopolymeric O-antigen transport system ATP-binding protein